MGRKKKSEQETPIQTPCLNQPAAEGVLFTKEELDTLMNVYVFDKNGMGYKLSTFINRKMESTAWIINNGKAEEDVKKLSDKIEVYKSILKKIGFVKSEIKKPEKKEEDYEYL